MKKNYTRPVVEVNIFDFADVVMTSEPAPVSPSLGAGGSFNETIKNTATSAGAIVVEW